MNETLKSIMERKSVRNYSDTPVKPEDLKAIAKAAIWSPNAMNKQAWHFSVVTDKDMLKAMNDGCRKGLEGCPVPFLREKAADPNFNAFFGAPAVIVVSIADDKFTAFDAGCAAQSICVSARSLGYGTCVTASTEFMFAGDPSLKAKLQIPEDYSFMCAITLGVEKEGPDAHVRERKEEVISFI